MRAITLALAVLAFTAVNADAQTPNARVFNGGAGLILYTVKAASTADFEMVLNKTKEALGRARSLTGNSKPLHGAYTSRMRRARAVTSRT